MDNCIDLNADVGESFGIYALGNDKALFSHITSANIACGMHAGDPSVMAETIARATEAGIAIGAHPGFPDLAGFGRRAMALTPREIRHYIIYQLGALQAFATAAGAMLSHVKPHGALYNMAVADYKLAAAIAEGTSAVGDLILVGLAGSELIRAGQDKGLRVAGEIFADRGYTSNGSLIPRGEPGALIDDPRAAARQVLHILRTGTVPAPQGTATALRAATVCLHGDGPEAVNTARIIKEELLAAGIKLAPLNHFIK